MRAVQNPEMNLGQVAIEDIQFDARCRDDIPAVLKGIQYIYCNRELRERIFDRKHSGSGALQLGSAAEPRE